MSRKLDEVLLEVASEIESGTLRPGHGHAFDQAGRPVCALGHVAHRLGVKKQIKTDSVESFPLGLPRIAVNEGRSDYGAGHFMRTIAIYNDSGQWGSVVDTLRSYAMKANGNG